MQTLMGFMLSLILTVALIPLLIRWAVPLGFLDIPDERKWHSNPTPRIGGVAMVLGVLVALLIWHAQTRAIQALEAGIVTLLIFGVWDDRVTLQAAPKFAGQALAILLAMAWGHVCIGSMTFVERIPLPYWVAAPLTFFFLLGGTNAFNLADGLDGLAGGMATLCLCAIALLAYTVGDPMIGAVAVLMVGALLGFLRFNNHPARVFMGDGGSQVLGFAAATLAILLTQDSNTLLSTALPLPLLGMPIIDTLMVMTERVLCGHSPFLADRRHIHYRLLSLGLEQWEAVSVLYLLQGGLFVMTWFLRYDSDPVVILSFLAYAALVIIPLRIAERRGLRLRRRSLMPSVASPSGGNALLERRPVVASLMELPDTGELQIGAGGVAAIDAASLQSGATRALGQLGPTVALTLALAAYASWVLIAGVPPSHDMRLLALALALVLAAGLMFRWRSRNAALTDKIGLYSCATLAIFLRKQDLSGAPRLHGALQFLPLTQHMLWLLLYGLLAWGVLISLRGSGEPAFRLTPLDILIALVVATVPNLPNSVASAHSLGMTIAELVLLFYAVEALGLAAASRWRWLSTAAVLFLLGVALRGSG